MNIFELNHDDYLEDMVIPLIDGKVPIMEYIKIFKPEEESQIYNLLGKIRETYVTELGKAGYPNINPEELYFGFPMKASSNPQLLGSYLYNLPLCKYMEKDLTNGLFKVKLNGNSSDSDLNFLSRILRQHINFTNLVLVFRFNPELANKLELEYIEHNNQIHNLDSELWLELLQSAYSELVLIIAIEHAFWHLIVAHIVWIAKRSLQGTEILKVFEMAEHDVFIKALEVKFLLFGTPFIFQQTLNLNFEFRKYMVNRIYNFVNTFDINTVYNDYFNLSRLGNDIDWIPGMKSNIDIINKFVSSVCQKYNLDKENERFSKYINKKYRKKLKNEPDINKFLGILFVCGTAFHSTTFEFTKLLFTDIFYNKKFNETFYNISLQTIVTNIDVVFGDTQLYKGTVYLNEVEKLNKDLEESRAIIYGKSLSNELFRNNIFSEKEQMLKTFSPNTYTTYV
jgi:hypothetical protein